MVTRRLSPEERAAKVDALIARLAAAVGDLTEGEQWTAMLRAASRCRRLCEPLERSTQPGKSTGVSRQDSL